MGTLLAIMSSDTGPLLTRGGIFSLNVAPPVVCEQADHRSDQTVVVALSR